MKRQQTTALLGLLLLALSACTGHHHASQHRVNDVAMRGAQVMPFSLERTTHIFSKSVDGGVQQVIVKDSADSEQIQLIREHLAEISQKFSLGDFSAPETIHGDKMPGLAALKGAQPGQIQIRYRELTNGAEITYTTRQKELIEAIHQWFDAQLSDHAHHAVPDHMQHQMHHNQ